MWLRSSSSLLVSGEMVMTGTNHSNKSANGSKDEQMSLRDWLFYISKSNRSTETRSASVLGPLASSDLLQLLGQVDSLSSGLGRPPVFSCRHAPWAFFGSEIHRSGKKPQSRPPWFFFPKQNNFTWWTEHETESESLKVTFCCVPRGWAETRWLTHVKFIPKGAAGKSERSERSLAITQVRCPSIERQPRRRLT